MPVQSTENLAYRRRSTLWLFYGAAVVSAIAISAVGKVPSLRVPTSSGRSPHHSMRRNYEPRAFHDKKSGPKKKGGTMSSKSPLLDRIAVASPIRLLISCVCWKRRNQPHLVPSYCSAGGDRANPI